MNKIDKLDKELEKAREKAAEWQAKIRELEKQKQEEENSQIVQAVRSLKLTPAQLMAFLNDPKNSLTASGHTDPKPEAPEKEEMCIRDSLLSVPRANMTRSAGCYQIRGQTGEECNKIFPPRKLSLIHICPLIEPYLYYPGIWNTV